MDLNTCPRCAALQAERDALAARVAALEAQIVESRASAVLRTLDEALNSGDGTYRP